VGCGFENDQVVEREEDASYAFFNREEPGHGSDSSRLSCFLE
jgi:hypothetical protein